MATELKSRMKSLLLVAGVSLGAAIVITGAWEVSHVRILENERIRLITNLSSVINAPPNVAPGFVQIPLSELPDSEYVQQLFAMLDDSQLDSWVYSSVAPAGYNGPIEFLIGFSPSDDIIRVRIMEHRETPGLGDGIEAGKSDWLTQFEGRNPRNTSLWALSADGGEFDSITAATITPRAVVDAIGAVVQYHAENIDSIRSIFRETLQIETENTQ